MPPTGVALSAARRDSAAKTGLLQESSAADKAGPDRVKRAKFCRCSLFAALLSRRSARGLPCRTSYEPSNVAKTPSKKLKCKGNFSCEFSEGLACFSQNRGNSRRKDTNGVGGGAYDVNGGEDFLSFKLICL